MRVFTPLLLLSISAGCSSGADPGEVRSRLDTTLPGVVDPTIASVDFATSSTAYDSVTRSLSALDSSFALPFSLTPGGGSQALPAAVATSSMNDGHSIAKALADLLFTDANYEGDGIYLLHGDSLCPVDVTTGAPSPDCVANVDQLQLRIKVEAAGDGLDLTLLVGPDRNAPLSLELRRARVTVVVDLGEAKQALAFVASITGRSIDLPQVLEGQVAVSLLVNGPKDVAFQLATRTAIKVDATSADGRFQFSTAAKDPLASLELDAAARHLTAKLDLGETQLAAPWSMLDALSLATGQGAIDWKGLSGTADLQDGEDSIQLSNLGLGDGTSTIKLDGTTLLAVDLNPNDGRRFDLGVAASPGGLPTFAFTPAFDLALAFDLQPLAAAGDAVASYVLGETYHIAFTGDAPLAQPVAPAVGFPGGLAIRAGSLSIASTAAAAPVVVGAGQCLVGDPVTAGEHPILGAFAVTTCP